MKEFALSLIREPDQENYYEEYKNNLQIPSKKESIAESHFDLIKMPAKVQDPPSFRNSPSPLIENPLYEREIIEEPSLLSTVIRKKKVFT
mgnify:CR=1 FL=1